MSDDIRRSSYSLGMVIKTGWLEFLKNFNTIIPITLLVYIPVNIVLSFVPVDHLIENYGIKGFEIYLRIVQLLKFFFGVLVTMSVAKIIELSISGQEITWKRAFGFSLSRWSASVGTGILCGLIVFGLLLLLIIPGIIWGLYYTFFIYVVALRGLSGKKALNYSKVIVKGQWWKVFSYLLVVGICGFLASRLAGLPFGRIPNNVLMGIISGTIMDIASVPFTVMAIIFFLNNDYIKQQQTEVAEAVQGAESAEPASETP
ncbi:MAG: hypothetical protein A2020_06495 [Lentisphaerae bacterium GWF2_45_14]|nr:MAG: hypothetical protein A2020_06495 [Lentisphaerae bacterium GWF2_45_14]